MRRPPSDPRSRSRAVPTWRGVLAGYVLLASIPLSLWVAARPLAGAVALTVVAGALAGARAVGRLVRCFYDCRGFAFEVGSARVTVTRTPVDDANRRRT